MRTRPARPLLACLSIALSSAGALFGCGPGSSPREQDPRAVADEAGSDSATTATTTTAGVPLIAADEPVFEFGSVAPGGSVTHVFEIVNRGTADLHIERVERT